MPVGSQVELAAETGSSTVQHVVRRYRARGQGSRVITLSGVPMGSYRYRVIATYSNGKFMTGSSWQRLYSYGIVSLNALCWAQGAVIGGDGCQGGAVQVGSNLFAFGIEGNVDFNKPPIYGTIINFPATSCRSLSLQIAIDSTNSQPSDTALVQVIDGTLAPQFVTVVQGAVTTFNVTLDLSSFKMRPTSEIPSSMAEREVAGLRPAYRTVRRVDSRSVLGGNLENLRQDTSIKVKSSKSNWNHVGLYERHFEQYFVATARQNEGT